MSIHINKPGLQDTLQDAGRYGYQHLGINPGGAMDTIAMRIANALVGNESNKTVLEMHFPAATLLFERTMLIALAGADFTASVNGEEIPLLHPVLIREGSVLQFGKKQKGSRIYLATESGFVADDWLHSSSTHLSLKAGGYKGRALRVNDRIQSVKEQPYDFTEKEHVFEIFPWQAKVTDLYTQDGFRFIPGNEFALLSESSKNLIADTFFTINRNSDRMGYRLQGEALQLRLPKEMISSAVTRGTMQLLPDGQMIILMADHQTTGGYPRVGHIISADIPSLAQMGPGDSFHLQSVTIEEAEAILYRQEMNLQQLQNACNFRLQQYLNS
ncbi:MAG: biotin-dependent carboxyltransferase family protein [Bacteroidota bacterium]